MAQVHRIDPIIVQDGKEAVAAYCRVSTDSKDQLNSYNAQIAYYTQLIANNPEWELADIYADSGITGTSIDKRDEFKRMLEDCRAGKIKRVLVKSVSRFARNTIELLETTRELRELGVVIVFEEQGIDTSQMLGEMQLTMFALAAQEESTSISKNMRWSYQKRMEAGSFAGCRAPIGYNLENGNLTENADAEVVSIIFSLYSSGMGTQKIADYLNEHYEDMRYWRKSSVAWIIKNEKYAGHVLLQKTFQSDTFPFKRIDNHGNLPQYWLQNHHAGIVSQSEFDNCQELFKKRSNGKSPRQTHLFTHRILCPDCSHHFRQASCSGKSYWICADRANGLSECRPCRLPEQKIVATALNMMAKLCFYSYDYIGASLSLLREIEYNQTGSDGKLYELDQAIAALNDKALVLQRLSNKGFITPEEFRAQSDTLASERQKLTAQRKKKLAGSPVHSAMEKLEELQSILAGWPGVPTEFDINVFDEIVEKIIPIDNNTLKFHLHCGLELTEVIPT